MSDQQAFDRAEADAERLQEMAGGWLEIIPVQDNDGHIRVRVFTRAQFEVGPADIGRQIVQRLRHDVEKLEAGLSRGAAQ